MKTRVVEQASACRRGERREELPGGVAAGGGRVTHGSWVEQVPVDMDELAGVAAELALWGGGVTHGSYVGRLVAVGADVLVG